jgi:MFS transporter, ACS family, DAL5 transporter family protein
MADAVDSEEIANNPKTDSLNEVTKSEEKPGPVTKSGDDALQLLESASILDSLDPHISRRLLRRIDIYIMPLICT